MTGEAAPIDPPQRLEDADHPAEISPRGWRELSWAAWRSGSHHEVPAKAAAAAFYAVLSFVPAMAAFGSVYGAFASPDKLRQRLEGFAGLAPTGVLDLARDIALRFAHGEPGRLLPAAVVFAAFAIATASSSIRALLSGLNTAYRQTEARHWIHRRLLSLAFAVLVAAALTAEVVLVIRTDAAADWGRHPVLALLELAGRWAVLVALLVLCLALLYRYGPDRRRARWRWVTPGSTVAALAALATSAGVSLYLTRIARYEHTYGGIGALVGLMIWVWSVMVVVLAGAELNWAIECKTVADTASPRDESGSEA